MATTTVVIVMATGMDILTITDTSILIVMAMDTIILTGTIIDILIPTTMNISTMTRRVSAQITPIIIITMVCRLLKSALGLVPQFQLQLISSNLVKLQSNKASLATDVTLKMMIKRPTFTNKLKLPKEHYAIMNITVTTSTMTIIATMSIPMITSMTLISITITIITRMIIMTMSQLISTSKLQSCISLVTCCSQSVLLLLLSW